MKRTFAQAQTLEAGLFLRVRCGLVATAVVISILWLACAYAPASGLGDNPTALAALQAKTDQAQPRDRCFLYVKLVSQMTDLAGQQFNSGESERASDKLTIRIRH